MNTSDPVIVVRVTAAFALTGLFGLVWAVIAAYRLKKGLPKDRLEDTNSIESSMTGGVYLLKADSYYKIGKANVFDRRIKQIKLQLPFPVEVIHKIYSKDVSQTEMYWHRRFAHKRKNGEWFALSEDDVSEFKSKRTM